MNTSSKRDFTVCDAEDKSANIDRRSIEKQAGGKENYNDATTTTTIEGRMSPIGDRSV